MKHQAWTGLAVPCCYLMPSFIFQPSWREILMKMHWSLNQTAEASRCAISINSHEPAKLLSIFAIGRRKERALGYYPEELIEDACNVYMLQKSDLTSGPQQSRANAAERDSLQTNQTLYLSVICHWLLLLYLSGKAKHSPWLSIPSTGALSDPPAVILDFVSSVPENQPLQ